MEVSFIMVLKCIQVNPRIERSVRSRIKIVKNGGCFALFSETKLQVYFLHNFASVNVCPQPVDFLHLQGEVQGRSLVTFATKLQMVEALRNPVIQRKYPNLAISKNSLVEK